MKTGINDLDTNFWDFTNNTHLNIKRAAVSYIFGHSSEYVGIFTTTPTARLHIKGSGATSSTTALLVQNANASASLTILDNGNVGIGKTTPNATLDVSGSAIISGSLTATSFTGSLFGTASYATSASYALTAQTLLGSVTSASFASLSLIHI